jgi:hypothetical protein
MDKLVAELLTLLREILATQQRLLQLALARREAMRTFDVERMELMVERERLELENLSKLNLRRQDLASRFKAILGRNVEPNVTEISKRIGEPQRSQLLGLAGEVRAVVEQLERNNRINATVCETVVKGLSKVLKVVTGMAQHAGLYMRNGRKAALRGIHLLEVTA